jgi:hypothetical protein
LTLSWLESVEVYDRQRFGNLLGVKPLLLTSGGILSEMSSLCTLITAVGLWGNKPIGFFLFVHSFCAMVACKVPSTTTCIIPTNVSLFNRLTTLPAFSTKRVALASAPGLEAILLLLRGNLGLSLVRNLALLPLGCFKRWP